MTLKDIASRAGVSVSTVSKVLNDQNTKAASEEVKRRIWDTVRESDYVPNSNAQKLRKKNESTEEKEHYYYALVCARSENNKSGMFFSELSSAIEYEAYQRNYILRGIFNINDLTHPNFKLILSEKQIKAIIVLGMIREDWINEIAESQKNVIFVSLNPMQNKHDVIYCDGYRMGQEAVKYLIKLGHRDIAYVGECGRERRYQGYRDTMQAHALNVNRARIVDTPQTIDGGYRGAVTLLQRNTGVSAIFCADDATAIGALKALKEHKIRVPEDMSIIGVNDIEMSRYISPMLTTVHLPLTELAREAVHRLTCCIEGKRTLPIRVELPFSIISRESCMRYQKGK